MKMTLCFVKEKLEEMGKVDHKVIGIIMITIPEKTKSGKLDIIGRLNSLTNNLTASAKGTKSPDILGLLGPLRM